ncbi:hypothetical protein DSL64_03660 [Dyadobacter luteus]|uniref:Uncharacterized protein n=1 Tax=Dyadobacter luteus TaxID=2259619 RepID=A0A3D8YIN2_9BACT|nr:hypothetical protein DSL64_03660 [Dyadobacter luteus]
MLTRVKKSASKIKLTNNEWHRKAKIVFFLKFQEKLLKILFLRAVHAEYFVYHRTGSLTQGMLITDMDIRLSRQIGTPAMGYKIVSLNVAEYVWNEHLFHCFEHLS